VDKERLTVQATLGLEILNLAEGLLASLAEFVSVLTGKIRG
jgi:hypothetical protein